MNREESTTSHDFINAKIRGMRSKLFESARLLNLTEAKTLPELFRRTYPSGAFEGHLQFERQLLEDHVRQLDLVSRFLSGPIFDLFQWLMLQYLLDNTKVALRFYLAGRKPEDAELLMVPVPKRMELSLGKLFDAADLRRFAEQLPVAELRTALVDHAKSAQGANNFSFESALESAYLKKLVKLAKEAGGWPRKLASQDVDSRNLMFLLRAKFEYNLPFGEISEYFIPAAGDFTRSSAEKMYSCQDISEALEAVPQACLPSEFRRNIGSLSQIEDALEMRLYRLAVRSFSQSILDVAVVVAYYYIKRAEFANLMRLTESIRHSLPNEEIARRLLRPRP